MSHVAKRQGDRRVSDRRGRSHALHGAGLASNRSRGRVCGLAGAAWAGLLVPGRAPRVAGPAAPDARGPCEYAAPHCPVSAHFLRRLAGVRGGGGCVRRRRRFQRVDRRLQERLSLARRRTDYNNRVLLREPRNGSGSGDRRPQCPRKLNYRRGGRGGRTPARARSAPARALANRRPGHDPPAMRAAANSRAVHD